MEDIFAPLPKEEVVRAVEHRYPVRIPMIRAKWWGEGLREQYGHSLAQFHKYPEDAMFILINIPLEAGKMNLSWNTAGSRALDAGGILPDWKYLDEFIAKMPDPDEPHLFDDYHAIAEKAHAENRYLLFGWWRLFFERPWYLRGMENLLVDYYENPDQVRRLNEALCDLYVKLIRRAVRELQPDGFWTSDDLGHQTQLMMHPDQFRSLIKPYYEKVGAVCRENNLHFWLHSCGNNTAILGDLADAGVNVFHPVQKYTMDENEVAAKYGNRLTFLAGIDVQHILQKGTPEEVRTEVRYLIDTFDQPSGGMCLAAGNGIVAGTPLENIDAFLDEALHYGLQHRRQYRRTDA
ncbi:MAG TPA: methylcobamide--CoM methyltransferase [Firmicutes bacterium]|nr:methylcobamide--CoM methyltransferase [Bacillota bacterium]